ncbi:regulator of (H+)-ATPase in vacuolar membrane [Emydomyces testavorans]|uniref:Regulator of (H+)-ATPase in vacuolar membrane n=1 Tax=Emydomyces testavorans TaxID=2070801 RepID=A0AAF0DAY8_9EURO|nr:regulator of (H+)-ATPase in vacuolar membrane [Emydomyces testavorans]
MRTVLPGRPPAKLQALSTALWDGVRIVAYITGRALMILDGPHRLLQTIYLDDTDLLEAVVVEESTGKIAVCSGSDVSIYQPYSVRDDTPKWSLACSFRSYEHEEDPIKTLSWGSSEELLVGNSRLTLWLLADSPRAIWTKELGNCVKYALFSHDAGLIASTGQYDRLVKIWRRLSFVADEVRFDVSYLPHPTTVTGMHWRRPLHREQTMENVLYTICADNKIRIWASIERQSATALQLWHEIDMVASIQPRHFVQTEEATRRYGFIIDCRDFALAMEHAVQRGDSKDGNHHALEHLIEVAAKNPEICVILDGRGHMCAWGLENVGCKVRSPANIFNIAHVEGLHLSVPSGVLPQEDYARFYPFAGGISHDSFTILAHYFDGRIEWLDSKIHTLFDPTRRKNRLISRALWSGHGRAIKKIVRTPVGKMLISRTDDNNAMIWRQRSKNISSVLVQQSSLSSDLHIHRTLFLDDGKYLVNLHHNGVSLWDVRSLHGKLLEQCDFQLSSKPLCVLLVPTTDTKPSAVYVAAIGVDMGGIAWEIDLPEGGNLANGVNGDHRYLRQFCTFNLGANEDVSYIIPVDPAGTRMQISGFLDLFATDIALSYTHSGTVRTWTAKVDKQNRKIDWLLTSTVETGIISPSLASAASMRKAALVDQGRTHLSIWDMNGAQLEFEEHFSQQDIIRDLDWTSTPDIQSILAVGFPRKVILLSQLRYDYLDAGPSWTQIREIRMQDLTPHPIGDSCWLGNGNLVVGAGNQLFVFDKYIEANHPVVTRLRIPSHESVYVDLFHVVSRLNGPLPVFHPQFLAQCILCGKTSLVHLILTSLYRKLKFFTEGDDIDVFLDMDLERIYENTPMLQQVTWKKAHSFHADYSLEDDSLVLDETVAAALNEHLARIALPHLSSREQFRLVDIVECVATVEKHRRSMDDNAARYLLFFRQHILRRSQRLPELSTVSWREIIWAFHSDSHEILADLVSRQFQGKMLWGNARESGLFMWITDVNALRTQMETIARNEYGKTDERNPVDCSLFYLALRKKKILQGLWRMATWHREQAATYRLLSNNFKDPRWQSAALKNAYALLGKRRFEYAAAFFLLADHLRDAAYVCINQLKDIQLAITITRAYEGDDGPVLNEILEEKILVDAASEGNRWMATWAFWMLNRRDMAVRALISPVETLLPVTPGSPGGPPGVTLHAKSYLSNDPALVVLYKQLREKTLQTLKGASKIAARDEWEFVLRNARLYDRMGCDLLALNLVRDWEFLNPSPVENLPSSHLSIGLMDDVPDPRKLLRRRTSLVVADVPLSPAGLQDEIRKATVNATDKQAPVGTHGARPPPTVFEEPDASSLLDSFGF